MEFHGGVAIAIATLIPMEYSQQQKLLGVFSTLSHAMHLAVLKGIVATYKGCSNTLYS